MFDIDHFKKVNDTYGHQAGDHVLSEISTLLTGALRAEDVFARYGGEEFAVICRGTDLAQAQIVGERMRKAVESAPLHRSRGRTSRSPSASASPACPTPAVKDATDLVARADKAPLSVEARRPQPRHDPRVLTAARRLELRPRRRHALEARSTATFFFAGGAGGSYVWWLCPSLAARRSRRRSRSPRSLPSLRAATRVVRAAGRRRRRRRRAGGGARRARRASRSPSTATGWSRSSSTGPAKAAAEKFRGDDWSGAEAAFAHALKSLPRARRRAAGRRRTCWRWRGPTSRTGPTPGKLFEQLYDSYPKLAPYHAYNAARCRLRRGDYAGAHRVGRARWPRGPSPRPRPI